MLIAVNEKTHTSTSRPRFTLFCLTVECWADSKKMILQPVASLKLFSHKTPQSTIPGSHRFVVKTQKFRLFAAFSSKISTNKKPFCYNSDKCWAMKSVEPWRWKIVRIFTQILHYCIVNAAGHSCFSLRGSYPREQFLTSAQDFFVSKQPIKKFKLIRKSYVPRALRFSCQGSAG